jgi:hypothetical protein
VNVDTGDRMQSGAYVHWDCLNTTFGAVAPFEYIRIGSAEHVFVFFKLKGIYAVDLLAREYGRLPDIAMASGNNIGGDGPTICVTPGTDTWQFVFDAASGDCPAGCIDHFYTHFTTRADGTTAQLEEWNGTIGMPVPSWVATYASRDVCH